MQGKLVTGMETPIIPRIAQNVCRFIGLPNKHKDAHHVPLRAGLMRFTTQIPEFVGALRNNLLHRKFGVAVFSVTEYPSSRKAYQE